MKENTPGHNEPFHLEGNPDDTQKETPVSRFPLSARRSRKQQLTVPKFSFFHLRRTHKFGYFWIKKGVKS
jgi:hypothetical protein